MRRYSGVWISLIMVLLLIAGCSSPGTTDKQTEEVAAAQTNESSVQTGNESTVEAAGTETEESEQSAQENVQSETRVVTTVNGDVEIPVNPERIAATYYAGELAALGFKPSGTVSRLLPEPSPNLSEYTDEAVDLGEFPPNMEAITAMAPDLIIAADFDELDYSQLSRIAPTVVILWTDSDVWGKLREVAKLFDKEAEAEAYIQKYEDNAAAARTAIQDSISDEETVSVIRFVSKSSFRAYAGRDVGHAFYNGLQLNMPKALAEQVEANPNLTSTEDISLEEIGKYAGDRLFILVTNEEANEGYEAFKKLSIWKDLPAVKEGKVYDLPSGIWFNYDPISVQATLDEAVRLLTEGP